MDAGKLFGRGIAFPPRIGANGQWEFSEGEENVREAIKIILRTETRERLRLNDFGGGLQAFLFAPNIPATYAQIEERINEALSRWEPRIRVESVTVEPDLRKAEDSEEGYRRRQAALVTIRYRLVATGASERVGLSLTLGG